MFTPQRIKMLLDQKPYLISFVICLAVIIWMMAGPSNAEFKIEPSNNEAHKANVKVERLFAESVYKSLSLYGRSEPDKVARVSSYEAGQVERIFVDEGTFVEKGTVVMSLEKGDLSQQLASAQALIKQREFEYQGAVKLQKKGLQDQVQLAQAETLLAQAKATYASLALSDKRTQIIAPFDGVINTRLVQEGDYVGRGDAVFELADLDPLVIRADVTQSEVAGLRLKQPVMATILNQSSYQGEIRYIASVADSRTNTFRIEAAFANPNMAFRAGFSAQLDINAEAVRAIKLSPAFMALDPEGNIGVKSIDADNRVVFNPMNIVKSTTEGVWMTGLGEQANVITLGQGFVRIGDVVNPIFAQAEE